MSECLGIELLLDIQWVIGTFSPGLDKPCRLEAGISGCVPFAKTPTRFLLTSSIDQMKSILRCVAIAVTLCSVSVEAFAPVSRTFRSTATHIQPATEASTPHALQRQRRSVAAVQTMGLFGLGAPEIAIILVAAAFLLGPEKLAELGKDAGKIAGELKEVPKEFQKGLAEGEKNAKSMKSSVEIDVVDVVKEEVKEK
jgi:sec-independent protein translocase protein TatA